jgi:uncharacterized protein YndB with AHSA1/START domain
LDVDRRNITAKERPMIKIAGIIVAVVAVVLAGLLAFAATRPDTFQVERSLVINAPPEKIFALINDLHAMSTWSPYEAKDPAMKRTYGGAASGKGAKYEFDGNSNVGKGRLEITDAASPSKVMMQLDMLEPLEGHNAVVFTLKRQGDATYVTWAMQGSQPLIAKLMGLFINMDQMIGDDFAAGLRNLKALAEK